MHLYYTYVLYMYANKYVFEVEVNLNQNIYMKIAKGGFHRI